MDADGASYLYLNREGGWLDFMLAGLELRADRSLALTGVPIAVDAVAPEVFALPTPSGPSGVAVGPEGVVFYTVPDADALALVDPCDGSERPAPCVSGPGTDPGQFRTPRGLAFHRARRSLLVADSANDRVQVLSLRTCTLPRSGPGAPGRCQWPATRTATSTSSTRATDKS